MKKQIERLYAIKIKHEKKSNELENKISAFLKKNEKEINQEVIDYIYWETDLKTNVFPFDRVFTLVTKNKEYKKKCIYCEELFTFYHSSRASLMGGRDTFVCSVCMDSREEKFRELSLQDNEDRTNRLYRLKTMPYKEYLVTEHWKEVRNRALKRANYKCQLCNDGKSWLNVHHRTYIRRGEEYNSDLIVLCRACHAKFHDKEVAND